MRHGTPPALASSGADPLVTHVSLRLQGVVSRLQRRRWCERGLWCASAGLTGLAASAWGLPWIACILLVAAAGVGVFALADSPPPTLRDAACWLDARAGASREDVAVLWQSALVAQPPFQQRVARRAVAHDAGGRPGSVRRNAVLLLSAAITLESASVLWTASSPGPDARALAHPGPDAASGRAVFGAPGAPAVPNGRLPRPDPARGVGSGGAPSVRAADRLGAPPSEDDLPAAGRRIVVPGGRELRPTEGTGVLGQTLDPGRTDATAATTSESGPVPGAPARGRTAGDPEAGETGAAAGEGVGQAAATRGDRPMELPDAPAAARGERIVGVTDRDSDDGAAAVRERADVPGAARGAVGPPRLRATPLAAGRWALTAAERSYLLRWQQLRVRAATESTGGTALPRSEGGSQR